MRRTSKGFTLIELMIVVAIIAIIAAIAIPSLLRSRLAANETSAAGALRNIGSTEAAWRQNDADGNGLPDYWTADWSGFFRIADGASNPSKFTDVAIAKADVAPLAAGAAPRPFMTAIVAPVGTPASKSGYFFRAMIGTVDGVATPYQQDGGDADILAWENSSRFGFGAHAEAYNSSGVNSFLTTEDGVVWAKDLGSAAVAGIFGGYGGGAGMGVLNWPVVGATDLSTTAAGGGWRVMQ